MFSSLRGCGALERMDFGQSSLWDDVVSRKE